MSNVRTITVPRFAQPGTSQPGNDFDWQQLYRTIQQIALQLQLINTQPPLATLGSIAGDLFVSTPFQGVGLKVSLFQFLNFQGTGHYDFPAPFTNIPAVVQTDQVDGSTVITSLTVTGLDVDATSVTNGFLILMGF